MLAECCAASTLLLTLLPYFTTLDVLAECCAASHLVSPPFPLPLFFILAFSDCMLRSPTVRDRGLSRSHAKGTLLLSSSSSSLR